MEEFIKKVRESDYNRVLDVVNWYFPEMGNPMVYHGFNTPEFYTDGSLERLRIKLKSVLLEGESKSVRLTVSSQAWNDINTLGIKSPYVINAVTQFLSKNLLESINALALPTASGFISAIHNIASTMRTRTIAGAPINVILPKTYEPTLDDFRVLRHYQTFSTDIIENPIVLSNNALVGVMHKPVIFSSTNSEIGAVEHSIGIKSKCIINPAHNDENPLIVVVG